MLVNEVLVFLFSFLVPFIILRVVFTFHREYFKKPVLRTKTGLQIHHLHYGIVLVMLASLVLLFFDKNIYALVLQGVGLGLLVDDFVWSLLMPGDRPKELRVYARSLKPTEIIFSFFVLFILLLLAYRVFII